MTYGKVLTAFLVVTAALLPCSFAQGAEAPYPSKPVRLVVGLSPGGATDIQARMFSQKLSQNLGQQFVVDNRAGAGGLIAYELVKDANADGYTVLAATASFTTVPALHTKPPYDPVKDFAAVSLVTKAPYMLIVTPSLPAKTIKDFIAYAKAKPGELNFGVSGLGTTIHLGAVWLDHSGVKITIVPYKGTGPTTTAVMGGQVQGTFANVLSGLPHVKASRVRVIAVTTPERSRVLPDIPTIAESGIPGYDVSTWHGWLVPKNTPAAIVTKINTQLAKVVNAPDIAARLVGDGGEILAGNPGQFTQLLVSEVSRWSKLAKVTGLKGANRK